jgi:putative oxidoreductase
LKPTDGSGFEGKGIMQRTLTNIISNKYLVLAIRLVLGIVFIYAAIHKIAHPADFAQDIYNYRMLPHTFINLMALTLPWLEIICGVLIVVGVFTRGSALLIGFMLFVFIIAISFALLRGLDISCGCFSSGGENVGHGVAVDLLIRDILMFVGSLIVLFYAGSAFSLARRPD